MSQASKRITDDMKKSIRDNLNGMVAKELQDVLTDYEKLQEEHEVLKTRLEKSEESSDKKSKEIKTLNAQIDKARELDKEAIELKAEQEKFALDKKIFAVEKEMLELRAVNKCQEQTMNIVKEMFQVPFQNRVLRESSFAVVKNDHTVHTDTDYNNGIQTTRSVSVPGGERVEPTHKEVEES